MSQQGGATTVPTTVGKRFEAKGALYLQDCGVAMSVKLGWGLLDGGYVPERTYNEEDARRLRGLAMASWTWKKMGCECEGLFCACYVDNSEQVMKLINRWVLT